MKYLYWIIILIFLSGAGILDNAPRKTFNAANFTTEEIQRLETEFGQHKTFINKYKLQSLVALSYYPELKDTEIEFVHQPIKTTMAARPKPTSVFQRVSKRSYRIFVNNSDDCQINLKDIPFNAQIGIIGHELAHIVDYEQSNGPGIVGAGLNYTTARTKANFEKSIDRLTIEHGLGWQLLAWADFALHESDASEEYKAFKADTYLEPEEIAEVMQGIEIY